MSRSHYLELESLQQEIDSPDRYLILLSFFEFSSWLLTYPLAAE